MNVAAVVTKIAPKKGQIRVANRVDYKWAACNILVINSMRRSSPIRKGTRPE
jgi:hypothetical protein